MKQEKKVIIILCIVFVVTAGIMYVFRNGEEKSEIIYETPSVSSEVALKGKGNNVSCTVSPPGKCAVYVCGAVKKPGVYELNGEARVWDALQAAGGFSKKAAKEAVNLARRVSDGEQITIPEKALGNTVKVDNGEGNQSSNGDKVNINQAEKEVLMTLPGVGESKAEQIITYRLEHGSYQKIEDIMNISGIKEGVFNRIKDKITV